MDSPAQFITAEEQCPAKPRGRKKAVKDTDKKPPAAAVGFDTVGMTAQQVWDKLEGRSRGRSTVRKGQSASSTGPGDTGHVDGSKKRKGAEQEIDEGERESKAPKTRKTRPKKRQAAEQEIDEGESESKAPKTRKTRPEKGKAAEQEIDEDAKESKTSKTRKTRPKKGKAAEQEIDEDAKESKASKKRRSRTENTKTDTKDPEEVKVKKRGSQKPSPEEPEAVSTTKGKSAEFKARVSRKSSAYHQAKKAALRNGKTDAGAKAAGKAVA
eukprot:symbB.v1.2.021037.t1/scaffold1797.1/size100932/4